MNHKTAASFLGMSRTKLYETERDDPGFPQRITVGKKKYFRTAELQEFINNKQPDTTAKPTLAEKVKTALNVDRTYVLNSVKT